MRIALIGNCQVRTYDLLCREMLGAAEVRRFDFSDAESREPGAQTDFVDRLGEYDLALVQPNAFEITAPERLRERYGERVVTVPNFYFRGLFPDICFIGGFGNRLRQPSDYHNIIVIEAYRRGLSVEAAAARFTTETYLRLGLFDAWESSLEEMAGRDREAMLPAAPLIERCARIEPAFFTVNHPTLFLVKAYLTELFPVVGLSWRNVESRDLVDPLAALERLPVPDEVAEMVHLPYRTTQRWFLPSLGRRFLDRADVIAAYYSVYDTQDPDRLRINSPKDLVRFLRARPEYEDLAVPESEAH